MRRSKKRSSVVNMKKVGIIALAAVLVVGFGVWCGSAALKASEDAGVAEEAPAPTPVVNTEVIVVEAPVEEAPVVEAPAEEAPVVEGDEAAPVEEPEAEALGEEEALVEEEPAEEVGEEEPEAEPEEEAEELVYGVEIYFEPVEGDEFVFGEQVRIVPIITGCDDMSTLNYRWEYFDGNGWHIAAEGMEYTTYVYVLDEVNLGYEWRLTVEN